jgi:hypothetical protein
LGLPGFSGKADHLYERSLHLAYPVIVDAAYVVATVGNDESVEEIKSSGERLVEAMPRETAIDAAQTGVGQLGVGAARGPHPKGEEPSGRHELL